MLYTKAAGPDRYEIAERRRAYSDRVNQGAKKKALRARAQAVLINGSDEQKAELLAYLRHGKAPRGRAYYATRSVGLPGLTLYRGGVVEISEPNVSNPYLEPLEGWQGDYPGIGPGGSIYNLLLKGSDRR